MTEKPSKLHCVLTVSLWIFTLLTISTTIGLLSKPDLWYRSLHQSPLTPPDGVFGPIWTVLYTLLALVGWRIWNNREQKYKKTLKYLFLTQLFLNWSWPPVFFFYQNPGLSFFIILAMILSVFTLMVKSYKTDKAVTYLLLPYLLWILFAAYLNGYIWLCNSSLSLCLST